MKAKANCNVNLSGVWHHAGDVFEISKAEAKLLGNAVTVIESAVPKKDATDNLDIHVPLYSEVDEVSEEQPKRRGRPKKVEATEDE